MKYLINILIFIPLLAFSQDIHLRSFGDTTNDPIIFLNGGPGGTSIMFETLIAPKLTNKYFVITYDRKGEGRSSQLPPNRSFDDMIEELDSIISAFNLSGITLLGTSFGGMVALKYSERYPSKIKNIILLSTPLSLRNNDEYLLYLLESKARNEGDSVTISHLDFIKNNIDSSSLKYHSILYLLAKQTGVISDSLALPERIKNNYNMDSVNRIGDKYYSTQVMKIMLEQEEYHQIDFSTIIKELLRSTDINILAFAGGNDALISPSQIIEYQSILGENNVYIIKNGNHSLLYENRDAFLLWIEKVL